MVLGAAALVPLAPVAGLLAFGFFCAARRGLLALASAGMSLTVLASQVPLWIADDPPETGFAIRVMSANLRKGTAVPASVVSAASDRVEVLAVQELTPDLLEGLSAAGVNDTFPYRYLAPRLGAYGVGLWSRYPLKDPQTLTNLHMPLIVATLDIPRQNIAPLVAVAHTRNPWHTDEWSSDMGALGSVFDDLRQRTAEAVLVAGDLNSTLDMRSLRRLLRNGYRDGAEQAGAGWTPTFPGSMPIPPLFAIDHIVTLRCTATSVSTVTVPGSDHRALVATVIIPSVGPAR
ncbi:endonuclease/exonuclease/phosphatase family protein [Mycolicibacterium novocastrense]|nr:endonuclease/exonuclease/phosphatase family protein [Mycolicibacterium novocastrense]